MAFKVLNDHDVNWVPIFNGRNQDNKKNYFLPIVRIWSAYIYLITVAYLKRFSARQRLALHRPTTANTELLFVEFDRTIIVKPLLMSYKEILFYY